MGRKIKIWLVHRGVWRMNLRSMPLALGYLKATAEPDDRLRDEVDIRIFTFRGGDSPTEIIKTLLAAGVPDVVGFSLYGWNVQHFGVVTETLRAVNPDVWITWGGPHVTGKRDLRMQPGIDVVAHGEAELTFRDLLLTYLGGERRDLSSIAGITFRGPDGAIVTTPERGRITNLDSIPSPFLTGTIPLLDDAGNQLYDVAIMETNRGCPYRCAFCYWGGAIGTKVRSFARERLRAELEIVGRQKIATVCLCDANFGMLKQDAEFLEDFIAVREKYGYPRSIETSWAKNKGKLFYDIVRRMKDVGLRTSFTLALQSLSPDVLETMQRKNMKLNDFEDLAKWLADEGMESYAELIWGIPGETCESFWAGYDRISECVSRIATYPHLILPNTEFSNSREKYKLITVRGVDDDFEYVFSHSTMSFEDNMRVQRFLFWSRCVAEHGILRHIWRPLRKLGKLKQSETLLSLDRWMAAQDDPLAVRLIELREEFASSLQGALLEPALRYMCLEPGMGELFTRWFDEEIVPRVPPQHQQFFAALIRYDWAMRPIHEESPDTVDLESATVGGGSYFVRRDLAFDYDFRAALAGLTGDCDVETPIAPRPTSYDALYFKIGYGDYLLNHEFVGHYAAKTEAEILREAGGVVTLGPHAPTPDEIRNATPANDKKRLLVMGSVI